MGTSAKNGREWSVWKASTNFHPMKFHEHVDTTYPKINYKSQLLTRQSTRDMAHTKPPNGSNSESRWGARSENDQTRDRWLDFRRMQVASDQITFLVESSDDITQDSEVFVPVRIVLDSVSLTRSNIHE